MVIMILYQNNLSFNLKRDQEGHPATHDTEGAGGEIVFELFSFELQPGYEVDENVSGRPSA